ncbi:hypothetical protein GCM10023147_24170 [Tsukamurella soli]|uniref:Uncharacterized protein n=1 Tax=Tsukamurella soli TaxID=644556 RepID=A0ABP8JNS8_9ACTN
MTRRWASGIPGRASAAGTAARGALIGVGLGLAGYGGWLLLGLSRADLISVAVWGAAGLVLHDGVFAPVCLALGHGVRRLLPARWWTVTLVAAVLSITVIALAIPVLAPRHGVVPPGGGTILDRPYAASAALALLAIGCVAVLCRPLAGRVRHVANRGCRRSRHA